MASLTTDLELLRTWQAGDFGLDLYYAGTGWGRVRLAYEFRDRGEALFVGDDFYPSPLHSYDGDEAVAALLGFLALRPGDTDREYFAKYNDRQLAWVDERAEALSYTALALSENKGG
jgi:hypothetical protein